MHKKISISTSKIFLNSLLEIETTKEKNIVGTFKKSPLNNAIYEKGWGTTKNVFTDSEIDKIKT